MLTKYYFTHYNESFPIFYSSRWDTELNLIEQDGATNYLIIVKTVWLPLYALYMQMKTFSKQSLTATC